MTDLLQQQLDANIIPVTLGHEEEEGFGALPLRNLTVGWEVPFDIYLKIKPKGEIKPQFVKGCAKGEIFRGDWHQKLTQLQIPCVFVSLQEMDQVMQYLDHHLELLLADENQTDLEKGLRVCDTAHIWMLHFFHKEEARTGHQVKLALKYLDVMFETLKGDRHNLMCLMEVRRTSYRLYAHCLNVCLLGLAFTTYLGWDQEKIRWFGLGTLIHDIGLMRTPRAILEKKGKLNEDEMTRIKRHPVDGFRMLQVFGYVRWEVLQMVLQHHENGDGSGYPDGLKIAAIKPWARILRILDSYEAMTADRPWRPAMEPKEALWSMRKDWDECRVFDQNFLKAFVKFLAEG